ncbi:MAG: hypothetical protein GEU79_10295, partial [Acidimicrobiia bacterium]|nr:hypothetical protein [Acidimicrobiia bacterium]
EGDAAEEQPAEATSEGDDAEEQAASEGESEEEADADAEEAESDPLVLYGEKIAAAVDGSVEVAFGTIKVRVPTDRWVETHEKARDELGLPFFSFLGVIEWTNDTATGDPLSKEVVDRFEVITTVSDVTVGNRITFSTDTSYEEPAVPSLVDVYAGANWHERESHEMFGVDFVGHPNLDRLYLPDGFVGNPLRKSFALLTREVKPWPGKVDVEGMPEDEEEEGGDTAATEEPATEGDTATGEAPSGDDATEPEEGQS